MLKKKKQSIFGLKGSFNHSRWNTKGQELLL